MNRILVLIFAAVSLGVGSSLSADTQRKPQKLYYETRKPTFVELSFVDNHGQSRYLAYTSMKMPDEHALVFDRIDKRKYFERDGSVLESGVVMQFYRDAIESGNCVAMVYLASAMENGRFGEVNLPEAIKYYKMAADKGSIPAMRRLGVMYMPGRRNNTLDDPQLSLHYFKLAADNGDLYSLFMAGQILYTTATDDSGREQGLSFIKLAASKGLENASSFLCTEAKQ